ncbi:MAG: AbrB/MazE/SpoVT family DNA-binding domain-containing protein [Thermoplasmatota archaeon]
MASKRLDPRLVDRYLRVVLPKEVVAALKVGPGDHVAFVVEGNRVEVRKVRMSLE